MGINETGIGKADNDDDCSGSIEVRNQSSLEDLDLLDGEDFDRALAELSGQADGPTSGDSNSGVIAANTDIDADIDADIEIDADTEPALDSAADLDFELEEGSDFSAETENLVVEEIGEAAIADAEIAGVVDFSDSDSESGRKSALDAEASEAEDETEDEDEDEDEDISSLLADDDQADAGNWGDIHISQKVILDINDYLSDESYQRINSLSSALLSSCSIVNRQVNDERATYLPGDPDSATKFNETEAGQSLGRLVSLLNKGCSEMAPFATKVASVRRSGWESLDDSDDDSSAQVKTVDLDHAEMCDIHSVFEKLNEQYSQRYESDFGVDDDSLTDEEGEPMVISEADKNARRLARDTAKTNIENYRVASKLVQEWASSMQQTAAELVAEKDV